LARLICARHATGRLLLARRGRGIAACSRNIGVRRYRRGRRSRRRIDHDRLAYNVANSQTLDDLLHPAGAALVDRQQTNGRQSRSAERIDAGDIAGAASNQVFVTYAVGIWLTRWRSA
jgi:hypothetical protein